jgi:hypothetical protein
VERTPQKKISGSSRSLKGHCRRIFQVQVDLGKDTAEE